MLKNRTALILTIALTASVACGQSEAVRQADKTAADLTKAGEAMSKATGTDASPQDLAAGMQALSEAMAGGDGKTVDPVPAKSLEAFLPDVPGWQREAPRSERMTAPIAYSATEAHYTQGDASVDVTITDSGFASAVLGPFAMMAAMGVSRESDAGHEKSITVSGQPGFEEWRRDAREGEVTFVIAKRYLVAVKGSGLSGPDVLHTVAQRIDVKQLSGLK